MSKRTPEEESRRKRREKTSANIAGFEQFLPDENWMNKCKYSDPVLKKEYGFGWDRAKRKYLENNEKEKCPFCGSIMEEFLSGYYCTDQDGCRYHTHNEG